MRTTTSWLINAGSMIRNAWGSSTVRIAWPSVIPIAQRRLALAAGSEATPARMISAMITEL